MFNLTNSTIHKSTIATTLIVNGRNVVSATNYQGLFWQKWDFYKDYIIIDEVPKVIDGSLQKSMSIDQPTLIPGLWLLMKLVIAEAQLVIGDQKVISDTLGSKILKSAMTDVFIFETEQRS